MEALLMNEEYQESTLGVMSPECGWAVGLDLVRPGEGFVAQDEDDDDEDFGDDEFEDEDEYEDEEVFDDEDDVEEDDSFDDDDDEDL